MLYLNLLIGTIIEMYFNNSRCMLIFSESSSTFEYKGSIAVVNLNVINSTIDESIVFRDYGCQEIVIQHKFASAILTQFEAKMKFYKDRFNFRKYLIIPMLGEAENLMQIFDLDALQYIVNLLIVVPADANFTTNKFAIPNLEHGKFKLMTHRYVGRNDNNAPEVLDLWFSKNQTFLNRNNLYPNKISDQQGRILRCATFNYAPYSFIEPSEDVAKGSENCIAHQYAKYHNMTLKYITDDEEWGIIYENWTGNGILGNLAIDEADMGYGALYTWEHEYGFLDFSKPVVRTGITCLVPAPQLASGWSTPFLPFSIPMWIGTGLSFIIACLVTIGLIAVISKHQVDMEVEGFKKKQTKEVNYKNISKDSFTSMYRIFLIQSLPSMRNELGKALKHMFVVFLFSLLMTASYSSGLSSVMTIPRYKGSITTVWDLANSGLHWGATQDAWIFSILAEERPQYVTLVNRFIPTNQDNLIEYAKTNHFAFSIERLPSGQYAIGTYITENVVRKMRLMHEDLYWEYCIFMLRKSSPLLNSLDALIMRSFEGGLIHYWEMKTAGTHMNLRVQNIVKYYSLINKEKKEDEVIQLKWMHVEGTFSILVVGALISTVCFVIELIIYKQNRPYKFAM